MTSALRALAARLREELSEVSREVERTLAAAGKAQSTGDDTYWDAVALRLQAFYTGVERMLEAIAQEVDGSVPSGPSWHRDLLLQLGAELPGRRPAVLSRACRELLEEYRGFQHLVRHLYTHSLRTDRVAELVARLPDCYRLVREELEAFFGFLAGLPPEPGRAEERSP